jgi:tetratricopeptide (TPR) repeat protein
MALALSNTLITVGEVAERQGNYLEARGAYEAALEDPDPLVVANAHACLGRLSWLQGAYEASFNSFERARAIAARLDAADVRARAEIGLGNVYYARGDYTRAREMYNAVRTNPSVTALRGKVLLNLGAIANIEGDLPEAERNYTLAARAFAESGDTYGQAQANNNLGLLHADRLEWEKADAAYAEAMQLATEAGIREEIGLITMNRAELSCAMGQYERALERSDEALLIFAEIGAEVHRGTALRWKGRALRELGQYPLAERALTEAMRIAHRAQAKLLEAETMQELGGMLALAGDFAAARKWFGRALDLFEALGATREAEELSADIRALEDR